MESSLLLLLLLLLLPFLLAAPAVSAEPASPGKPRSTCQSLECVKLAAGMVTMMNPAVDPCEDFYSYACGNFPNTVLFDPRKVTGSGVLSDFLHEDTMNLMRDKVRSKSFEVLLLQSHVTDSDPDIQDLYRLTRLFFHSCVEWIGTIESDENQSDGMPAKFFGAIFNGLMDSIKDESGLHSGSDVSSEASKSRGSGQGDSKPQLEAILAAMVRAGGKSLLSVTVPEYFGWYALQNGLNLTNVIRATVKMDDRRWHGSDSKQFVTFFTNNNITSSLRLDNVSSRFMEVTRGLEREWEIMSLKAGQCARKYGLSSVAQLDQVSKCVNRQNPFSWKLFFERLLMSPIDTTELVSVPYSYTEFIVVLNFYKRQPVYSGTANAEFSTHVSYLIFDWLMSFGDFFPGALRQTWRRQAMQRFPGTVEGRSKLGRMKRCQDWTTEYMNPVFERMYRVAYHPEGFSKVEHFIQLIKEANVKSVLSQDWIEGRTKNAIIDKIRHLTHRIGLDDWTSQQLKECYKETLKSFRALKISEHALEGSFGSLMSIVLRAKTHVIFDIISGKRNATLLLDMDALEVNAAYSGSPNKVLFPMAILQPPAYHNTYPDYINLGSSTSTFGHEIGHAFADSEADMTNQLGKTEALYRGHPSYEGYLEREACVRSSYGNYSIFPGGPRHKSGETVIEDISDILGLKAAFGALQILKQSQGSMPWLPNLPMELNQDQLFFVSAAQFRCTKSAMLYVNNGDEHSPNHLRVRGMMQNSWEFARTFKCRPGQPMNPRRKCTFW